MRESRCMSLLPRTTLHSDSEHLPHTFLYGMAIEKEEYHQDCHFTQVCVHGPRNFTAQQTTRHVRSSDPTDRNEWQFLSHTSGGENFGPVTFCLPQRISKI
jgi:hypothetical protein